MEFTNYLKTTKQSANAFARKHNLPSVTVWRAEQGKPLRPHNAERIETATEGMVSFIELVKGNKGPLTEKSPAP